jgi:multiple sugar transport system substrate-binding protein
MVLAGCSSSGAPAGGSDATTGVTITVALAQDAPPQAALDAFKKDTGITVKWVNLDWDSLQTKISAAASANSYFADATNVDWSRVGQLGRLGWFQPMEDLVDTEAMEKDMPQMKSFTSDGHVVGVPYTASFMVTTVNKEMFEAAGVKTMPTTIDEYTAALHAVKDSGVAKYPLNVPFAAAEGLSTYWYETTGAFGGTVLDGKGQPLFTDKASAGYKAFEWLVNAAKDGLVSSGSINTTDTEGEQAIMAQGEAASTFSDYSGLIGTLYDVPDMSKVTGKVVYIPTPGVTGPAANLSNPDGIGIPAKAKHPAAAAKFIEWFTSADVQADFTGLNEPEAIWSTYALPSRLSVVKDMAASGNLPGGDALAAMLETAAPVFPEGAPIWYPEFSSAVYTNLHAAVGGELTVDEAITKIADTVTKLAADEG